ncbi:MAG: aminomethyl-transferring glycine dehydrogenase subunit GcvPB, partial [Clostridiaceae bacterium]|nr:aminomethyl-transferring glycine dehydrogenase subunit GcvPB [Clostridiaceae bacterium]
MPECKHTPLIFDLASHSRAGQYIRPLDVPKPDFAKWFGKEHRADEPAIPDVDEITVVRHYSNLSNKNYHVEMGPYPLGSCTMKYNPKVNEDLAALAGFAATHPLQPDETVQGNLELLYHLERLLNDITGMDAYTFQPAAGAHGELA